MQLTIVHGDNVFPVEVEPNSTFRQLINTIQPLINAPPAQIVLAYDGRELPSDATIASQRLGEYEVVHVAIRRAPPTSGAINQDVFSRALAGVSGAGSGQPQATASPSGVRPGPITSELFQNITSQIRAAPAARPAHEPDAEQVRQHFQSNPQALQQLLHRNPLMAEAIVNNDLSRLRELLEEQYRQQRQEAQRRHEEIQRLNANPFDREAQQRIEELIRQEQVQRNMEQAFELNPESFGRVVMLYIDCEINGVPVKAFVDSGAQITLMSQQTAERCGLLRLVDRRFANTLVGVGTCEAIGRIHSADMMIGDTAFTSSFTVVEDPKMEFLLGLDMLRRHRCCIDLAANVLRIGDNQLEVPFLSEKDIPKGLLDQQLPNSLVNSSENVPTGSPSPATGPSAASFPESVIENLMSLGPFTREQVIQALRDCAGNENHAASQLLS